MDHRPPFVVLRDILADLYSDGLTARRVVADADLNARRIAFSSQAANNWQAILTEATQAGQVEALFAVVLSEYSGYKGLGEACQAYREVLAKGGDPLADETAPAPGESPYKGLDFFHVSDAGIFFGRERLTSDLVTYLRDHRFLAVIGASGSGKSSLVRAGLVPALQQNKALVDGVLPPKGGDRWPVHIITPKAHPLEQLAASLTRGNESVTAQATLMDDLVKDP